ncbi:MAG TPA: ABC transporter permease [Terriglobales bacterium]|nr:ABC transporter permease [Terriglobales bacterium]
MDTLRQDLKFGFRTLLKNKGFTIVAVVTLALAIGANTAIFTIVNAVLLRPMPVSDPQSLVILGDPNHVHGRSAGTPRVEVFSYLLYAGLSDVPEVFSSAYAAGDIRRLTVATESNDPGKPARGRFVTGKYFSTLGVTPAIGRFFGDAEADMNNPTPVAVISHNYWLRQFAGDPSVVGRTVRMSNYPVTIIGVAREGFDGEISAESQDVWIPMSMQPQLVSGTDWTKDPRISWLQVMARLKPGVSREQAAAAVNVKFRQMLKGDYAAKLSKQDLDDIPKENIRVESGLRGFSASRSALMRPMVLLMIIVGLVLVMACTNISNMLLARSSSRTREIALRVAIGAKPWRVIRQLITESVLLAFIGGLAGLAVAQWGTRLLLRWVTQRFSSIAIDTAPDGYVLAFAAALCLITGLLFGLVPALRASKIELTQILGQTNRVSAAHGSRGVFTVGNLLIAAQFAVSMLVITAAGLLVRSLYNLQDVDLGYPRERLIVMKTDPMVVGYDQDRLKQMAKDLPQAIKLIPGVEQAAVSENGLFSGTESGTSMDAEGFAANGDADRQAAFDNIGAGYFKTIGARFLLGRDFDERDNEGKTPVTIVNESFANFYFRNRNPIGHKITVPADDGTKRVFEIVGVVKDVRDHSVRDKVERRFYLPMAVNNISPISILNFEIRTVGDPSAVTDAVRQRMKEIAPGLPVVGVQTIDELASREVFKESMLARLSGMFGVLALVLAAVGLYGLMSYMVVQRTKEIGIRLALGAQRSQILGGIVKRAMILAMTGVAIGVPIALLSGHAMKTVLYEVGAGDPLSLIGSMLILASVAVMASLLPAMNAIRVDPADVLRYE